MMIRTSLITAIAFAGTLPSLAEDTRGVCGKDPVVTVVDGVTRDPFTDDTVWRSIEGIRTS